MGAPQSSIFSSQPTIAGQHSRARDRRSRTSTWGSLASSPPNSAPHLVPFSALRDLSLIQRAIAGDPNAQEQLFKGHAAKLYRTAFRVLRNKEDAEDALQDCWLSVCTNLKSFEGRSSFYTWLTRVVINSASMILRKKRNVREVSMDAIEETDEVSLIHQFPDGSPNPEQCFVEYERKKILSRAIRALRPRIRVVVQFGQLQELSLKETARRLGISVEAAKGRLFHARAALRKSLVRRAGASQIDFKGEQGNGK
jgi:RNA polymerase sigma factor (sigma-70 family)